MFTQPLGSHFNVKQMCLIDSRIQKHILQALKLANKIQGSIYAKDNASISSIWYFSSSNIESDFLVMWGQ